MTKCLEMLKNMHVMRDVNKDTVKLDADYVKGINSFDYIDKFNEVDEKYAQEILNEVFKEENMALSVVKGKNK